MVHRKVKSAFEGVNRVISQLNKELKKIENGSAIGLVKAAILLREDMDKTSPTIPVDTGYLRSSWFATPFKTEKGPAITVGFSANYAVWVHENLEAKNWTRSGSGPKFFEKALDRNKDTILQVIKENVIK